MADEAEPVVPLIAGGLSISAESVGHCLKIFFSFIVYYYLLFISQKEKNAQKILTFLFWFMTASRRRQGFSLPHQG